jgi:uncharacterized membrane protein YhaH (DUF805 family)
MGNLLFSTSGRLGRSKFILASAGLSILLPLCTLAYGLWLVGGDFRMDTEDINRKGQQLMIGLAVIVLIFAWSSFALNAKRAHDVGRPALSVAPYYVPLVIGLIPHAERAFIVVSLVFAVVWSLDLGLRRGSREANTYGQPPGVDAEAVAAF